MAATPKPIRKMEKKDAQSVRKTFSEGRGGSGMDNMPKKNVKEMAKKYGKSLSKVLGR